ncbi:hypothetical protein B0T16DRAFT_463180 [Cercophora newfieldiana]|uniref:Uncharacterized protein n=1 Tax=Cercophora newfieldiana TaxID=92897 RepID=A0AA40CIF0_9PEZI|nr:hypothetical protein B0T16DRAFT_463180 [Cercophora newfieldiana]
MPLQSVIGDLFGGGTEYPVFLCGLLGAGKSALMNGWNSHPSLETNAPREAPWFNTLTVRPPGRGKVTFRDVAGLARVESWAYKDLRLTTGQAGLLFVHDANDSRIDESLELLRHLVEDVLLQHGGRGVWVLINKMDLIAASERLKVFNDLETRFGFELCKYGSAFRWHVLPLPEFSAKASGEAREVFELLAKELSLAPATSPQEMSAKTKTIESTPANTNVSGQVETDFVGIEMDDEELKQWWSCFLHGEIKAPWKHVDYLRAVFLTILEPENEERGILEIAADVATKVHSFKQRFVSFSLPLESRTKTVFWVYHVKMAMDSYADLLSGRRTCPPTHFALVLEHMPELRDEKLPSSYFSSDMLGSKYPEKFWMLPDLRALTEPPQKPTKRITLAAQGDPERLLRFAFAVVQRYLRKDSKRRRSWFIDLGFATLEQQTIRLRIQDPSIPAYSLTQIYFYVQMVHLALSQLQTNGTAQDGVQHMSYPVFRDLFQLSPTLWTKYYSHTKWFSLEARVNFLPPDLQSSLPNSLDNLPLKNRTIPPNDPYHARGLLPELPSLDILNFHLAVLLEDVKSLPNPLPASSVTSHPALLSYIHTHILSPRRFHSTPSYITPHLTLLSKSTPYPLHHLTFWTTQSLHALHSTRLPSLTDTSPTTTPWKPSGPDPTTGAWTRYHNCPCHHGLAMSPQSGPSAVNYPSDYPYEHPPQQRHACLCHRGLEIDHDQFAALCGEAYARRELAEKRSRGLVAGPSTLGKDPWENFMRFNPALAWEGFSGVWYSPGAWEGGTEADRRGVEGVEGFEFGEGDGSEEGEEGEEGEGDGDGDVADELGKLGVAEGVKTGDEEDEDWEVVA